MKKQKPKETILRSSVLKQLCYGKSLSCAEISGRVGKSVPLVTRILNEMIGEGRVIEQGYAPSSGGRRPLMYALKPDEMYIVSVAMDQLATRIALVDPAKYDVSDTVMFELPLRDNPDVLPVLTKKIRAFVKQSGVKAKIAGIGIGIPGFVDPQKGINYTYLDITGDNLRQYLEDALDLPVYLDNDSSLVALAELRVGEAESRENVMVINIGWGIGLGMILNGEIFRGHTGFAGEFSHIPLSDSDTLCSCGKRGCLETEASLLVVVRKAQEAIRQGETTHLKDVLSKQASWQAGDKIVKAAVKGDQLAVGLLLEAAYAIGRGLAILIHIMNPELIVLSGRGAMAGKLLLAPIQQALHKYAIPRLADSAGLQVSELGYDAELIGATALVIENMDKEIKKEKELAVA